MERLTERLTDKSYCISDIRAIRKETFYEDMECRHGFDLYTGKAIDKLAEYEDLEERLRSIYGECDGLLGKVVEHLERHEGVDLPEPAFKARLLTDEDVDKWEKWKNLEEQGKLLKLPCAVGDTVYVNHAMQGWYLQKKDRPYKVKVVFIGINEANNVMHVVFDNGYMLQFWFSEIGKKVFLTRKEAEVALKELED